MRYLKFQESNTELYELCDSYLTYIKDKNISIKISSNMIKMDGYRLSLIGKFKISDISDDIYQFIKMIRANGYIIDGAASCLYLSGYSLTTKKLSIGEILSRSDNYWKYRDIREVSIPLIKIN